MRKPRCTNPFLVWVYLLLFNDLCYNRHYFFYLLNGKHNEFSRGVWDSEHEDHFDRCPIPEHLDIDMEADWLEYYPLNEC